MLKNGMPVANNATLRQSVSIPEHEQQKSHKKKIDLELAHARFIRPSRALLAASSAEVWNDLSIRMSPDSDCISCRISTMKATARIKHPSTPVSKPGQVIYLDILPAASDDSLTPKSYFPALLILVDAFSRFTRVIGMSNKSTKSVTAALSVFAAEHRLISSVKLWKIEKIKGDAGSEFNSTEFEQFCIDRCISVSFAPPKHQ
jgi:transposase InsO family protein